MDLTSAIAQAYQAGSQAWPTVKVSPAQMAVMAERAGVTVEGLLSNGSEFFLASAAAIGDRSAIDLIDRKCLVPAGPRLLQSGATPEDIADALQTVRERLFVGPTPRIATYNAIGPLAQWIKIITARVLIDLQRRQAPHDRVAARLASDPTSPPRLDPAVALTKAQFKKEFAQALQLYLPTLNVRDRAILRLYLVEGISVQKISAAYNVNRSTVARWIWTAGETLLGSLHQHFKDRFGLVPQECDSLARLVQSQVDVDLRKLLVR